MEIWESLFVKCSGSPGIEKTIICMIGPSPKGHVLYEWHRVGGSQGIEDIDWSIDLLSALVRNVCHFIDCCCQARCVPKLQSKTLGMTQMT